MEGQTDILTMGLPYICPYNVNSIMNPILVACLGLGLLLQPLPGQATGARGRRGDHEPPDAVGVRPGPPPELHRLLRTGPQPRRPTRSKIDKPFEESFATDPWYIHLYRTGHAYHGVHPFYMWYWCAHALAAPGRGHHRRRRPARRAPARVPPASTLADALEMAQDVVGPPRR